MAVDDYELDEDDADAELVAQLVALGGGKLEAEDNDELNGDAELEPELVGVDDEEALEGRRG